MQIKKLSDRTYELKDIENLLASKDKEYCFRIFSAVLSLSYYEKYQIYINHIQMIPAVVNSFLLYANGTSKDFTDAELEKLIIMLSSLDIESGNLEGKAVIYQSYLKVLKNTDYAPFVLGRIGYIFEWLKNNRNKLEFQEVTKVNLEDFLMIFWGASSVSESGKKLAAIDPKIFFSNLKSTPEEIDFIVKNIEENFSITMNEATIILQDRLTKRKKLFESSYTIFEEKPFLKIGNVYLLIAPHFAINNLISICSKFFISQYSLKDNNIASTFYGEAFESYCNKLLESSIKGLEYNSRYKNQPNEKGPDALLIRKGSIPILFEHHKSTIYQSLYQEFSIEAYRAFLKEKVVNKFGQFFKWMRSHNYNYNSVDLWKEIDRTQFVVVLAHALPLTCFDEIQNLILEIINEKWIEVTGQSSKLLRLKNIYILGVSELEVLVGNCILENSYLPLKLFEYKKYSKSTPDLTIRRNPDKMSLRDEFTPWLMKDNRYQNLILDINKEQNERIFKRMLGRIKVDESLLAKKIEEFDKNTK